MQSPEVVTKVATTATYSGSTVAVYFGLSANEIAAFGGLIVAVLGLLVTWYYKAQSLKVLRRNGGGDDE